MAISVFQTQSGAASSTNVLTVTITATTAGSTLIAAIGSSATNVFSSSVVAGGSSNLASVVSSHNTTTGCAEIWYLDGIPSGITSVVLTCGTSPSHYDAVIYEVGGLGGAGGSFDKSNFGTADSTTPLSWTSNATGTLSQAAEILIGCTGLGALPSTPTGPASPWVNTTPGNNLIAGQRIVSATTSLAYAGSSVVSGTGHSASVIASFKGFTGPPFVAKANQVNLNQSVMRAALW